MGHPGLRYAGVYSTNDNINVFRQESSDISDPSILIPFVGIQGQESGSMTTYDAICTGAGPAGATAARALAKKGLRVLLLDRDTFPRDKTCGGGLRPDIMDRFPHLRARAKDFVEAECRRVMAFSRDPKLHFEYSHP